MKIHRFYVENIEIDDNNLIVTQETSLIHQLKNVFRYKKGQILNIFNEKIGEIEVELDKISKKDMSFIYKRNFKNIYIKNKKISLYMSVIKNSNFDLVIEKAVELNIDKIIPVITDRTIKNNINYERLSKINKEATEQCGRLDLMFIDKIMTLENAIIDSKNNNEYVFYGSLNNDINLFNKNKALNLKNKNIALFIGPEGGYSESEFQLFETEKILPINLGKNVLRAETAAIVGCGIISVLKEDSE